MAVGLARDGVEKKRSTWVERLKPRSLDDPRTKFGPEAQEIFLNHFAETGRHEESADLAGVCYDTTLVWRKTDPTFQAAFEAANRRYKEKLRREIERRGVEGWEEPLYQGGVRVLEPVLNEAGEAKRDEQGNMVMRPASVRKFSDRLLEILAKRQDPEFRDRVDMNSTVSVEASSTPSSTALRAELERLSPEGREHLRRALEELASSTASVASTPQVSATADAPSPTLEDSRVGEVVDAEIVG